MIVVSQDVLLLEPEVSGGGVLNFDSPVVGWQSIVTASNIAADTEDPDNPATNLANQATNLKWVAEDDSEQYLTVVTGTADPIDYVGVARHNFGTEQIQVSLEGDDGGGFDELIAPVILPNDAPVIFRVAPDSFESVRLRLQTGNGIPEAAVVYVGKLLILQRRIYVGHTPIVYGRDVRVSSGMSEVGNFLGRIVTSESRSSSVSLQNITPSWYRTYMDPFVDACKESPFFFAWRPGTYPLETGFAWTTGQPRPVNQKNNGMMRIDLQMAGIA